MISQITEHIFIGNADLSSSPDLLGLHQISAVIKLYQSPPDWTGNIPVYEFPFPDGEYLSSENLGRILKKIGEAVSLGYRILIVCRAGISRSCAITLAYLVSKGVSLPDAYELLTTKHPVADPHQSLWESLFIYFDLDYSWLDVLSWRIKYK